MCFRYPGSKKRASEIIRQYFPRDSYSRFVEPCAGRSGLLLDIPKDVAVWMNEKDPWVYGFWHFLKSDPKAKQLILERREKCIEMPREEADREWIVWHRQLNNHNDPLAYLCLNLWSAGGIVQHNRRKPAYLAKYFFRNAWRAMTESKIDAYQSRLKNVWLTNKDCFEVLNAVNQEDFVFIDPPYLMKVYGWIYSYDFTMDQHRELNAALRQLNRRWLLTIGNCVFADKLYAPGHHCRTRAYKSTMAANGTLVSRKMKIVSELIIWNYSRLAA